MIDVLCIGNLVADVLIKPVNFDSLERGKLHFVDTVALATGGCAMNPAVDMARLGVPVGIAGQVGRDGFGEFLSHALEEAGVDTRGLGHTERAGTSVSAVLLESGGERTFLHQLGANGEFREEDIPDALLREATYVFCSILLTPALDGAPMARVLKRAKELGKITLMDTVWDHLGRWMEAVEPCLPYVDYFLPSVEEAAMLVGDIPPADMARRFRDMGVQNVVIKTGSKGCYADDGRRAFLMPCYHVAPVVDTTGAGDSFVAGFITALRTGASLEECCRMGHAVGAHCVMGMGASTGIPGLEDVKAFMAARPDEARVREG